jgi:hypothetical protein
MLSNKDLYAEIEAIEEVAKTVTDPVKKAELKAACLSLKLLHNIRANQVSIMMKEGVELVKSPKKDVDAGK